MNELESLLEGSRNRNRDLEADLRLYKTEQAKEMRCHNAIWNAVNAWCKKHPEHAISLKATINRALEKATKP